MGSDISAKALPLRSLYTNGLFDLYERRRATADDVVNVKPFVDVLKSAINYLRVRGIRYDGTIYSGYNEISAVLKLGQEPHYVRIIEVKYDKEFVINVCDTDGDCIRENNPDSALEKLIVVLKKLIEE